MKRLLFAPIVLFGASVGLTADAGPTPPAEPTAQADPADCDTAVEVCVLEVPNDPLFPQQWGPQKIQAPEAWDIEDGDPAVVVAIVDTGIDCTHPDLIRCVPGYDFINNVPLTGTENSDDNQHGTHVAGIAAATKNNSEGIAGVAQVAYMPVKVCTSGGSCPDQPIVDGLKFAADNGAEVANLSLGGSLPGSMEVGVDYAHSKDVLVVSACGNSGTEPCLYPAAFVNSMAVSCTDPADVICWFSSRGTEVDVAAPGLDILSTLPGGGYGSLSGTSMSTPHVSGVAGLVRSADATLTNVATWALLEATADDIGDAGWDPLYGSGRVNAFRAVVAATPDPPPPPPPPVCEPPRHLNPHGKCVGPKAR